MGESDSTGREGAAVHSLIPFNSIRERAMLTKCPMSRALCCALGTKQ